MAHKQQPVGIGNVKGNRASGSGGSIRVTTDTGNRRKTGRESLGTEKRGGPTRSQAR